MTPAQAGRVWEASEERARRRPAMAGVICVGAACATVVVMVVVGIVEAKSGGVVVHGEDGSGSISNPSGERDMKYQHNGSVGGLASVAAVGALALAGDVCAQQAVQWRVEDGGNGHWYRTVINDAPIDWNVARQSAETMGGHLATPVTENENLFIAGVCSAPAAWAHIQDYWFGPWLGGYQPDGSPEPGGGWVWLSGEPWGWTGWQYSEPNDGCGGEWVLHYVTQPPDIGPSAAWNDEASAGSCGMQLGVSFVVEWSADCNDDGIVDYGQILTGQFTDTNANGIPDICEVDPCPGDVVQTGTVDAVDLAAVLGAWGTSGGDYPRADINHDGIVAADDLGSLLAGWGACP